LKLIDPTPITLKKKLMEAKLITNPDSAINFAVTRNQKKGCACPALWSKNL
jgi:hypothetical protein